MYSFRQHFVPATPTHPQPAAAVTVQAGAQPLMHPLAQPQGQNLQHAIQPMAPQQPHPNLFQEAVLEHAASAANRPQTLQATP